MAENYKMVTYEDKDQEIKKDIDGAAADEEAVYIETVTLCFLINTIPRIVEWSTTEISFTLCSRRGLEYHWNRIVRSIPTK